MMQLLPPSGSEAEGTRELQSALVLEHPVLQVPEAHWYAWQETELCGAKPPSPLHVGAEMTETDSETSLPSTDRPLVGAAQVAWPTTLPSGSF